MKNQLHKLRVLTIVFALAGFFFSAQAFAGSISGNITKTSDGTPVVGATISAQSSSYSYSTSTDVLGNYYMWVSSGTYTVKVSKDLFHSKTVTGVAEGEVKNLTLDFNHWNFIGGSYYNSAYWDQYIFAADFGVGGPKLQAGDEIGVFDNGTCVGLLILDGPISTYYQPKLTAYSTLSDGQHNYPGFTPGHTSTYKCYTSGGQEADGNATRTAPWGGTPWMSDVFPSANPYSVTQLTFTGYTSYSMVVTVKNNGNPVPNVKVLVNNVLDTTDALGQVTYSLLAGSYAITATPITPGLYDPFSGTMIVTGSGTYDIILPSATTTISGKVTKSSDASPVSGATISATATSGGGTVTPTTTDINGNYTLTCPNVTGTYTIRAVASGLTSATKTNVTVTKGTNTPGQNFALTEGSPFADVTGDPNLVWTIYLKQITFSNYDMNIGDEIAIYDNTSNLICGKFVLTSGFSGNPYQNEMVVFLHPDGAAGDVRGHAYSLKAWSARDNQLMTIVTSQTYSATATYVPAPTYSFPPTADLYSIASVQFGYVPAMTTQNISLHTGTNFVSSYVINKVLSGATASSTVAMDIDNLAKLADAGAGIVAPGDFTSIVADRTGGTFVPVTWQGIEGPGVIIWNTEQAYKFVMVDDTHSLTFKGDPCNPATPIIVDNTTGGILNVFIPYLQSYAMDASYALRSITSNPDVGGGYSSVTFVKDDLGHMNRFLGGSWVNNIGNTNPGKGYQVQIPIGQKISLIYSGYKSMESSTNEDNMPTHFQINGDAANWIYTIYLDVNQFGAGDEIAAYDGDRLVGATKLVDATGLYKNAIPVFRQLTDKIGYQPGDPITLKGYDHILNKEVNCVYTMQPIASASPWMESIYPQGDGKYSLATITKWANGVSEASNVLLNVYPNPAHDYIKVVANQNIDKVVMLNVLGAIVLEKNVSSQETQLSVGGLNSGIYILQITVNGQVSTRKVFVN